MARLSIGCSGFNYKHWRGNFYPEHMPQKQWFSIYCNTFSTVELNVTFYRLPNAQTFDKWRDETPEGFCFALKGSRFITHIKRLNDIADALERFFENALHLKDKLEVVLWQFPPRFFFDRERLLVFLNLMKNLPVRQTLEFRNESWLNSEVVELCREHNISLCSADSPDFLKDLPVTADFIYIRRHGHDRNYTGSYSREELSDDATMIKGHLQTGRDVYIYFNNDLQGYAPRNAAELMEILKQP